MREVVRRHLLRRDGVRCHLHGCRRAPVTPALHVRPLSDPVQASEQASRASVERVRPLSDPVGASEQASLLHRLYEGNGGDDNIVRPRLYCSS
jgi:hypothetical protein